MIVNLHFIAIVHRHPFFPRFDGNADEHSGIVIEVTHLVAHANHAVAKLSPGSVEQPHTAIGTDKAAFDLIASRPHVLPSRQVFPVEERLPFIRLSLEASAKSCQEQTKRQPAGMHLRVPLLWMTAGAPSHTDCNQSSLRFGWFAPAEPSG